MRVLIIANPISGKGASFQRARVLAEALADKGHPAEVMETRTTPPEQWLLPTLDEVDLLVVAGGDGAVRLSAGSAAASRTPIYHFPCGTENLFSREWCMDREASTLLGAIERRCILNVDLGHANGEPFVLMASVGYDAAVVEDLALHRRGSISHLTYAMPLLRQLWQWRPPHLEVRVDGERIDEDGGGAMVVVGNCRQYGARFDPALHADMHDGLLDVVYYPVRSRVSLLRWLVSTRLHRHVGKAGLKYVNGRVVEIRADEPFLFQLDGDPPDGDPRVRTLTIELDPGVLPVLVPGRHEGTKARRHVGTKARRHLGT